MSKWKQSCNNTICATSVAGTAYPFGAPEFIHGCDVRVAQALVFFVVIC